MRGLGSWVGLALIVCATARLVAGASANYYNGKGKGDSRTAISTKRSSEKGIPLQCEVFCSLRDDLQENLFHYECADAARRAIRLAFHDAIGYSLSGAFSGGGADGSILTFASTELTYAANNGLSTNVDELVPFLTTHPSVSAGDLVQFAAAVALTNCPGAPRLRFLAGRPAAQGPAGDGTVPTPVDSASAQLARLADAGFSAVELVHLLAAHSVARASQTDPVDVHAAFDSTPSTFDSQFYLEVLLKGKETPGNGKLGFGETGNALGKEGEVRITSDYYLAHDTRTACTWQSMINNQAGMTNGFAEAMAKLAVTGHGKTKLIDCSEAVPSTKRLNTLSARYPAGMSHENVQQTCKASFPRLDGRAGKPFEVPYVP